MQTQLRTVNAQIDPDAIARGLYDMMTDEYRAALAFGMLPGPLMTLLDKTLGDKFEDMAKDQCEKAFGFRPEKDIADQEKKRAFVREATRLVSSALYNVAPMVV